MKRPTKTIAQARARPVVNAASPGPSPPRSSPRRRPRVDERGRYHAQSNVRRVNRDKENIASLSQSREVDEVVGETGRRKHLQRASGAREGGGFLR